MKCVCNAHCCIHCSIFLVGGGTILGTRFKEVLTYLFSRPDKAV